MSIENTQTIAKSFEDLQEKVNDLQKSVNEIAESLANGVEIKLSSYSSLIKNNLVFNEVLVKSQNMLKEFFLNSVKENQSAVLKDKPFFFCSPMNGKEINLELSLGVSFIIEGESVGSLFPEVMSWIELQDMFEQFEEYNFPFTEEQRKIFTNYFGENANKDAFYLVLTKPNSDYEDLDKPLMYCVDNRIVIKLS